MALRSARWLAALLLLLGLASPCRAGWSGDLGALVVPGMVTTGRILPVPDGHGGAFVLTLPQDLLAGHLVAQHVLADGSLASGWPAGGVPVAPGASLVEQCDSRSANQLGAAVDGAGGLYVMWGTSPPPSVAGTTTLVQHLDASGAVVAGWPPGGRPVTTSGGQAEAAVYGDGSGGVFVIWRDLRNLITSADDPHVMLQHFLADGTRAPGFAALGRFLGANMPPVPEPRIAAAFVPDAPGSCWALITRASADTLIDPAA